MRRRTYLTAGAVVLVVTVATVAAQRVVSRSSSDSPESVMHGYFAALAARDGAAATAFTAYRDDPPPLVNANRTAPAPDPGELIKGEHYTPPSQVEIGRIDDDEFSGGRRKVVKVAFNLGARRVTHTLILFKHGEPPVWRIEGGRLLLRTSGHATAPLKVNDTVLAEGVSQVRVFPGEYRVQLAEHPLVYSEPLRLALPDTEPLGVTEVRPLFRRARLPELEPQVRSYLDACAKVASLAPKDCPFATGSASPVRDIRWTILAYPRIDVGVRFDLTMFLKTEQAGRAEVTGVYPDGSPMRLQDHIIVQGMVKEAGGTMTWVR